MVFRKALMAQSQPIGQKIDWSSLWKKEDWWALYLGLLIFFLALPAAWGYDLLGWTNRLASDWLDWTKSVSPLTKTYAWLHPAASMIFTYIFILALLTLAAKAMGWNLKKFIVGFTFIYWATLFLYWIGHYAYISATPEKYARLGISWSLSLTGDAGYLFALLVGLIIANFFRGFAAKIREAARPELFVKIAIVLLGAHIGAKAVGVPPEVLANFLFRGICAIIEAYLIYWSLVYFISRRYFGLNRQLSAVLASGISICGVSAAMATAAAIRADPKYPVMVSSLVVIFAVIELLILPFLGAYTIGQIHPLVIGAWMGLAVKTDGAAAASTALSEALILGTRPEWKPYLEGWIVNAGVVTKVFIDIFIGVWAFILAVLWVAAIEKRPGEKVRKIEIWFRFPKFVIGYFLTFLVLLFLGLWLIDVYKAKGMSEKDAFKKANDQVRAVLTETDAFYRKWFFALTFFSIGIVSDFRTLKQAGYGKLAKVYFIALFGFIIWIGLFISYLFFHDVHWFFILKGR